MRGDRSNYWLRNRLISRRRFVSSSLAGGAGLVGAGLVGCGDDDDDAASPTAGSGNGNGNGNGNGGSTPTPQPTTGSGGASQGGTVLIRMPGNYSGLEPVQGTGGSDHQFLWTVYDNLISYNANMETTPGRSLAEDWEAPDEETFTFFLRDGVMFHDDTPFNAESVLRNWEWGTNPDITSNVRTDLEPITGVETPDELTATYALSGPYAPLEKLWGDRPGMMISPASIDEYGADIINNPVGSGAFVFEEQSLDSHVTVRRNDAYWQSDHPFIDEIRWLIVPDSDVAVNGLETGEINLFWNFPERRFSDFDGRDGFQTAQRDGVSLSMIYLNNTRPPLDNEHLRRAIAFAIDRQTIVDALYEGLRAPATSFMGPGNEEFDPEYQGLQYDPDQAREELAMAGMEDGFSFGMTVQAQPDAVRLGEVIQDQLGQVGIEVELNQLPAPDYYLNFIQQQQGDSFLAAFSGRVDPWQTLNFLFGAAGTYGGAGTQVHDDLVDDNLAEARATYDFEARRDLYREVDRRGMEMAYGIALDFPQTLVVMSDNMQLDVFGDGKPHLGQGDVHFTDA